MKHRIVIETMGDGSERVTIQREAEATFLQRLVHGKPGWYTIDLNSTRSLICAKLGIVVDYDNCYSNDAIVFPSVEAAKQFIDECIRRLNARTVVDTRYEEYPK